jgi:hypothetical protein
MRRVLLAMVLALGCGTDFQLPGGGSSDVFTPDPPSVYVAKVKNILVGQAPTDAEISAVRNDPNALSGLIGGWMQTPEYDAKMLVFFELAFQQTQISGADFSDLISPRGFGGDAGQFALVQNVRESFARSVLELVKEGRPFTEAFTTHRLMMTPALMMLYAFLDARQVHDDGTIADSFAASNPTLQITLQYSTTPTPLDQAANPGDPGYMVWNSPDLLTQTYPATSCNGLTSFTVPLSAANLFDVLLGTIPAHRSPAGDACPIRSPAHSVQLADIDFSTWKMVTIRAPQPTETPTRFFDVPGLRAANELALKTPHPGFFSTPAFFANWPTNQSNQMRVTVNQALIVALGAAYDGGDETVPPSTPGLDTAHAQPGTMCYSCHQLLDPTRSIFSSTYSWFYSQQDQAPLQAQPGLFAFQGVVQPMTTIQDFSQVLATHPLVAKAWVQKLCYYVNSAPCDPTDPEYQRLVADFASGFSWTTLVRELLSSPITTNTKDTVTRQTNGQVIAVSRRDHVCAALNNRLGFNDICQLDVTRGKSLLAQVVSGLPSDGYGRGAVIPVLPNDPNLFYRAGLDAICTSVSQMVVDAPANPMQPGAQNWSSAQPDAAVADFVSRVMALTALDRRAAAARTVLRDHYQQALAMGATPTNALRSTFIVACLSPSFLGIGM